MSVVFRQAYADDLDAANQLVVRSMNDLTERHGFGPMAVHRPPQFQLFSLDDDPGGFGLPKINLGFWVSPGVGCAPTCGFSHSYLSSRVSKAIADWTQYLPRNPGFM